MRCSSARGPIVRSRLPSSLRAGTGAVRRRARRRPRAAADRQPARVPHRMARAAAHWRHRRARLLGRCAGQGTRVHGRLLAFARRGLGRCRWLRAHRRPHERHAQSRRLHARFGRGRQRADGPAWSRPRSLASPARCWASACTPSSTPTGTEPVDDALRRHGAERRAGYQMPDSITWSAHALPRNANGKLLKGALRGLWWWWSLSKMTPTNFQLVDRLKLRAATSRHAARPLLGGPGFTGRRIDGSAFAAH